MAHVLDYIKRQPFLIILLLLSFLANMIISLPSGSSHCFMGKCGVFFWGAHTHDALWHFAIEAVSFTQFPFIAPTYSGEFLTGYNYLLDIGLWILHKVGVNPLFTYFKLLPILWFGLITYTAVLFARRTRDSASYVWFLLFFIFFGGSFSYFLTYAQNRTIQGASSLLSMQSMQTLVNIQFAFSLVLILWLLILVSEKKTNLKKNILIGGILAGLFGLKFYGGVIGTVFAGLYMIETGIAAKFKVKDLLQLLIIPFLAFIGVLLFYNPFSSASMRSGIVFDPLATVHPLIEDRNLLYRPDLFLQRYFLIEHGIGPRLIYIELYTLALFIVLNFGTRVMFLLRLLYQSVRLKISRVDTYVYVGILVSFLFSTLFIQKGVWWNTVQFLYYSLFLSAIPAAHLLADLWESKYRFLKVVVIIIFLSTLPSSIDTIRDFTTKGGHGYLPSEEIAALSALKKMPKGIVFAEQYEEHNHKPVKPFPLYYFNDSAYVSAFSGKQLFLGDIVQLELTGVQYKSRLERIKKNDCTLLNEVSYVYDVHEVSSKFIDSCVYKKFPITFQNNVVSIYKTN